MAQEQKEVLIVGQGPAGCSAALYLTRAGLSVTLVGKDGGALARAEKIENYYGLEQPLSGKDLYEIGRQQCAALGAELVEDEVVVLDWLPDGSFSAQLAGSRTIAARSVLLATGKAKRVPGIEGLSGLEGKGVSYCAVCDAFFYRGRKVAVLGGGVYAKHEMEQLLPLVGSMTLLTNGSLPEFEPPEGVTVLTAKVKELQGENTLAAAVLDDGTTVELDGLFVALGSASAGDIARKMGLRLLNGAIPVNEKQATELPGLFAAGDCTGLFAQIAFAVAQGANAGLEITKYLRK